MIMNENLHDARNQEEETYLMVADSISKWYEDHQVLKNVSLVVKRSEVLFILGPSGSGKSTLCRVLCGIEKLDEGTVWIED